MTRICWHCTRDYEPVDPRQRYCSEDCKRGARHTRRMLERRYPAGKR